MPDSPSPRRRLPAWTAAIPALLITVFFVRNVFQFSGVAAAINPNSGSGHGKTLACVETYGITLNTSDEYVPELMPGVPADTQGKPREISTVVKGLARNGCEENLKNLTIKFAVRDDQGKRGNGTFLIDSLTMGEIKPFERAWMGRVTSYDITAER